MVGSPARFWTRAILRTYTVKLMATVPTTTTISRKPRVFGIYIDRAAGGLATNTLKFHGPQETWLLRAAYPIAYFITGVIYILLKILNSGCTAHKFDDSGVTQPAFRGLSASR